MNLVKNCEFYNMIVQTTAGSSDLEGAHVLDMQGFEGVAFIAICDVVTASGEIQLYAQYSDSTSTTDMVDDTGTCVGTTATDSSTTDYSDSLLVCDVYKPLKRYVSCHLDKSTQNSETRVIAIKYRSHGGPTTQSTGQYGTIDSDVFVSPTT